MATDAGDKFRTFLFTSESVGEGHPGNQSQESPNFKISALGPNSAL